MVIVDTPGKCPITTAEKRTNVPFMLHGLDICPTKASVYIYNCRSILHVGVLCSHVHMKVKSRTPLWEKLLHVCKPCWSIVSRLATCCHGRQQPLWLWLQCVAKKWTGIKSWCPNYTPCKKVNGGILESLHLSVLLSSIFCTRDGPAIINIHWCFCRTNVQAMQHEWDICPLFSSSNGTFPRGVHYNHGS